MVEAAALKCALKVSKTEVQRPLTTRTTGFCAATEAFAEMRHSDETSELVHISSASLVTVTVAQKEEQ